MKTLNLPDQESNLLPHDLYFTYLGSTYKTFSSHDFMTQLKRSEFVLKNITSLLEKVCIFQRLAAYKFFLRKFQNLITMTSDSARRCQLSPKAHRFSKQNINKTHSFPTQRSLANHRLLILFNSSAFFTSYFCDVNCKYHN